MVAAPTYFNSASNPADNGSLAEPQTGAAVTPPSSMVAGDLVVVFLHLSAGATGAPAFTLNNAGGQSWANERNSRLGGDASYYGIYWCVYDGTWDADPSWDCFALSGTNPFSIVMHVFRPPSGYGNWALDTASTEASHGIPSSPFTITITGHTPAHNKAVTIAWWSASDDNTCGSLTGAGWVVTGTAQYRNTGGGDQADSFAHYLHDTAAATGNPSKDWSAGDACASHCISFYAISSGDNLSPSLFTNSATFHTPTITTGAVGLTPSLYSDGDTFNAHTALSVYALTASLHTNAGSFYVPAVAVINDLVPSLFSDGDTFHSATVATGPVNLAPSLYSDADAFHAPTAVSTYLITPSLFSDADAFPSATVTPGSVGLTPSLFADGDTFYSATVALAAVDLQPPLYADADSFHAATVAATYSLTPALLSDGDSFYTSVVSATYSLSSALLSDADTFYAASVAAGPVGLGPSLYSDADTFFAAAVSVAAIDLSPPLLSDSDTFYSHSLTFDQALLPPFLTSGVVYEPHYVGDLWSHPNPAPATWVAQSPTAETWTPQAPTNTTWTEQ